MRVLVVSAHYPPNFVSGGTLQPQRLARGLRARGHDVSVYAGWLGERPPLEAWNDTDETGLPVRWIVSTPWTGWQDDRNWWNPKVGADFRAHVGAVAPDVVHIHSLQSLGASLVPAAKAAGASVVVTMHDFWWLCTRQFLVDRSMRPCSLVVDAGVCPCEVDVSWREHRAGALRTVLGAADLVLAPSESAARVLLANGVAPGRVDVDENGLEGDALAGLTALRTARTHHRRDLRLLYTGGPNPLKGSEVLVDAVERAASTPGWSVTAYGIAPFLAESGRQVDDRYVEVADPFEPVDLPGILAAHDVLVLPSIMRETHSLVTREALAAGVPVVATDTMGPEEVVEHDVNGLVVPAGDAVALAGAIERLASDPALMERLREGAASPLVCRSLEQQLDGLEARFGALSTKVQVRRPASRLRHVVFVCGISGAPLRYRAHLPLEALALQGVTGEVLHYRDRALLGACGPADVVVFYRVPATHQVLDVISTLRAAGTPVVFDVDDLIFDPEIRDEIPALRLLPDDEARLWLEGVRRYRTTLEACDAFIGSTAMLVEQATRVTGLPAYRFDNGVGFLLARRSDEALRRQRAPGPPRIGYLSGTNTHDDDWRFVEGAVAEVLERRPEVELWLGGHLPDTPVLERLAGRIRRLPFVPWLALPAVLRDLDVNLAPLEPGSRFNEAKSAIKWLEAALCATPTVASLTGPFGESIVHFETGVLAETPTDFVQGINALLDPIEGARIGALARRRALLEWAPARQGDRYLRILQEVLDRGPDLNRRTTWEPVALDEPPMDVTLDDYADDRTDWPSLLGHDHGVVPSRGGGLRGRLHAARAAWRAG
jgi:glycosyltransferase involved in cell wall biosynthesis